MNNFIPDYQARLQALNPNHSFIVQAPAGSGKTELLTQRYLVLLAQAKIPEEIIAITFTRKAAGEMRARILEALHDATVITMAPETPHAKLRWELAKAVIERDQIYHWNLLENPNRLRIQTIDALCAQLTKQMPILAKFGAQPNIADDPSELYEYAARETLNALETGTPWNQHLITLLSHLDNDHSKVEKLLCDMLAKRDQWLPYVFSKNKHRNLRQMLESNLQTVITETLYKLSKNISANLLEELFECLAYSIQQLKKQAKFNINDNEYLTSLTDNIKECFANHALQKDVWLACADLLLTDKCEWRKAANIRNGFPPHDKQMKQRMESLLSTFAGNDTLLQSLLDLRMLPALTYTESQWQILIALLELLPILVAQLQIVFQSHHTVDYTEIAQSALMALGDPQNPTDLALTLDYQIKHLLVDEFQDTSIPQLRLVEQLTAGWQANDGRTLFLVGDPMQSIYRFRKAEVALFLQARQHGIGAILLTPLTLTVNFRSTHNIVDWVNNSFKLLLPAQEDISSGAVSFTASIAHHPTDTTSNIDYHWLVDADNKLEAATVTNIVKDTLAKDTKTRIAILVRARTHIREILIALKRASIPYRAVEIETLSERAVVRDLLALTRALLHPADRIAWLAVLRAPWCGLTLEDLHALCSLSSEIKPNNTAKKPGSTIEINVVENSIKRTSIWTQLLNMENKNISMDGKQRLEKIIPILDHCLRQRERFALASWVEVTWLALNGPACLNKAQDLNDAKAFFNLLKQLPTNENAKDYIYISKQLNKLYAASDIHHDSYVEVMTMHKAKGLEFDVVILPGLHRTFAADDPELLLCWERPNLTGNADLIFAPIKSSQSETDNIYNYLRYEEGKKANYEITRLLYVAATRAKKTLHLTGILKSDEKTAIKAPAQNSLLAQLWPAIGMQATNHIVSNGKFADIETKSMMPSFKRLTLQSFNKLPTQLPFSAISNSSVPIEWKPEPLRHIGTVVHQILCKISQDGLSHWNQNKIKQQQLYIKNMLLKLGVIPSQLEKSKATIERALTQTLACKRGRWILDNSHSEAQSEYALTTTISNEVISLVIDRTFVDQNNVRWIIDYKTADYQGDDLPSFLQNEFISHKEQLENYANAIQLLDNRKINLGLYFPLLGAWKEWEYTR